VCLSAAILSSIICCFSQLQLLYCLISTVTVTTINFTHNNIMLLCYKPDSRKVSFSLQRTSRFQTIYCQEIQRFWHENIQTVQLLWLHLQHQSVLEEGQTISSPTADSNTCHSDVTACGNKWMSSQTAYEDFLLLPSPM